MFVGNDDTIWFIRFVVLSFFLSFVRSRLARVEEKEKTERMKGGANQLAQVASPLTS